MECAAVGFRLRAEASQGFALAAWTVVMLSLAPLAEAQGQTPPESAAAFSLFKECVQKLHSEAYKPDSIPVILTKCLHGLVQQLGGDFIARDRDFRILPEADAQAAFEQEVTGIAAMPGQRTDLRSLVETALQAYCRQHDPYTRYVRSEDWKLAQLMNRTTGSGIGMTVNEKAGVFRCFPLSGSPAEAADIKAGDRLISVEGKPVEGKPLEYIAGLIKGAAGTEVMLRVEKSFGRSQNVKVVREVISSPTVIAEKKITGAVLRIRRFNKDLLDETRKVLATLSPTATLTLDLRGCPGGSLDVAIEFAALFLEPGEPIVTLRDRAQKDENRQAVKPREFKPRAIILLQDEGTASAAELVIAALTFSPSNRAASQGIKTYGKGVFQTTFELQGGGHLVLTTGETIAPHGRGWDGTGLVPSIGNEGRIFPQD